MTLTFQSPYSSVSWIEEPFGQVGLVGPIGLVNLVKSSWSAWSAQSPDGPVGLVDLVICGVVEDKRFLMKFLGVS